MYNDGNDVTTPGNILVIMGISNYQELMFTNRPSESDKCTDGGEASQKWNEHNKRREEMQEIHGNPFLFDIQSMFHRVE